MNNKVLSFYLPAVLFGFLLLWDLVLFFTPEKTQLVNYLYNGGYALLYVLGIVNGFLVLRSQKGKNISSFPVLFFMGSIGALAIAQYVWVYYNMDGIGSNNPYPSVSDFLYISFYPLVIASFVGVLRQLKLKPERKGIVEAGILSITLFVMLQTFVAQVNASTDTRLIIRLLNAAYPTFDILLIALGIYALRVSRNRINPILLLFAAMFLITALGDMFFYSRISQGFYWNGDISDLLYTIAAFLQIHIIRTLGESTHETEEKTPEMPVKLT